MAFVNFNPTGGVPTPTWPGGWTQAFIINMSGGSYDDVLECRYRECDGSEGASINVTTTPFVSSTHETYRITGHDPAIAPESTTAQDNSGGNAAPDPPSLTPTGGSKDYLWLAACGFQRFRTVDVFPTNYSNGLSQNGSPGDTNGIGTAERALTAASENPGAFTLGASTGWVAATLVIHPLGAAAASAVSVLSTASHPGRMPGIASARSSRFVQTVTGVFIPAPDPIVPQPQIRSNHPGQSPGRITGRFVQTPGGVQVIAGPAPGPLGVAAYVTLRHPGRGPGAGAMSGRFAVSAAVGATDSSQALGGAYQDQIVKVRGVFPEMW